MTSHPFGNPFTGEGGLGLSDAGQMGTGPDLAERLLLLKRVRDGLKNPGTASSSDEGQDAA